MPPKAGSIVSTGEPSVDAQRAQQRRSCCNAAALRNFRRLQAASKADGQKAAGTTAPIQTPNTSSSSPEASGNATSAGEELQANDPGEVLCAQGLSASGPNHSQSHWNQTTPDKSDGVGDHQELCKDEPRLEQDGGCLIPIDISPHSFVFPGSPQ